MAFPSTRYQGSKRKLAAAIVDQLRDLDFTTVLDAFGGTGAVAHALKCAGKSVTYNDHLTFNHQIGLALIENDTVHMDPAWIDSIGNRHPGVVYTDVIERVFQDIYYTDDENRWLDAAVTNIGRIACLYQRALAWFALFQAAMVKRPYNLFHRRNLYMRTAHVARGFGNKVTWDRPFPVHFAAFVAQANRAIVDSDGRCRAICRDVLEVDPEFDLVYIDPPYINGSGLGVDYRQFYHFLEGMVNGDRWPEMIDNQSPHRRLIPLETPWSDRRRCHEAFERLFERFHESILVVSYRSDGIPTIDELVGMVERVKREVRVLDLAGYQYALSTRRNSREVLLIAL